MSSCCWGRGHPPCSFWGRAGGTPLQRPPAEGCDVRRGPAAQGPSKARGQSPLPMLGVPVLPAPPAASPAPPLPRGPSTVAFLPILGGRGQRTGRGLRPRRPGCLPSSQLRTARRPGVSPWRRPQRPRGCEGQPSHQQTLPGCAPSLPAPGVLGLPSTVCTGTQIPTPSPARSAFHWRQGRCPPRPDATAHGLVRGTKGTYRARWGLPQPPRLEVPPDHCRAERSHRPPTPATVRTGEK